MSAPTAGLLAAVVVAVGFWFLLYQPKADEQTALQSETVALEDQQAQLRGQITRLREIQAAEVEHRAELARLEEYIPGTTAQPVALREFQVAADAAGVEITAMSFGDPVTVDEAPETGEPNTALAEVPVTMTVDGGYFQLVDLLRRLEVDVPRALLIETVNVAESPDGFPALSTTWAGNLFAIVPITAPPAPATTTPEEGTEDATTDAAQADGAETPAPQTTENPS